MATIHLIAVTPEATVIDVSTSFVTLPLYDGEKGVGLGHAPLIARLGSGELRFETAGRVEHYFVDGGFVQIADNVVSVIADRAIPAATINAEDVQQHLAKVAKRRAAGDEAIEKRNKDLDQARAMLRVAQHR